MRKSLNGKWVLSSSYLDKLNKNNLIVNVPGSIYHDLLMNKVIDEPYYRDNETKMLDLMNYDYAYERTFVIKERELKKELNLLFLGLDTVTEIYLNDELIKKTYNMHRRYLININDYVVIGNNKLKIVIKSCLDFIKQEDKKNSHQLMNMEYAVKGYAGIRKAHAMFGWDWGPQMPDGGIWRDVYLEVIDSGRINDCLVFQDVKNDTVSLEIKVNSTVNKKNAKIKLELTKDNYHYEEIKDIKEDLTFNINIDNPTLWYPVGYGKQDLYDLKVSLIGKGEEDSFKQKIGLRKMEVERIKDQYGESFTIKVNDKKIFIKGSDYIIEDNILPRKDIKHTEFLLDSMLYANQNTIRVWGGGLYPSDDFYRLCDEKGILIWQDLMFACGYYNMENDFFVEEIKKEIIDNIKRIHNHPAIILICGNNENETAALDWNIPSVEYTKKWYLYQYEELIPGILKEIAPDLFYWPSSPSSGGGFNQPNSDSMGDMHYWGVWHNNEPIENYRKYYPRLLSEFGMQSFPSIKTVKEFTLPSDRNIYSYVMERHQKNRSANQKIMNYIGSMFKYPKSLDDICYVSQLIQAVAVKYCVEHLRRNYGRCMGAIYWQLNDCWPVASWSSIDYYDRYKALHYFARKFYAKVLVSIALDNETKVDYLVHEGPQQLSVHVTSEYENKIKGQIKMVLVHFDGTVIKEINENYSVDGMTSKEVLKLATSLPLEEQKNTYVRTIIYDESNNVLSENDCCLLKDKYLELQKPVITYKLDKNNDIYTLSLISNTYTKYVWVDLKKDDVIFSDNFFNLYPNEEKKITFSSKKQIKEKDIKVINLTDSY